MERIALIISLNFNPGHVSHMLASYKQCEDIGYHAMYLVDKAFVGCLPKESRIIVYGEHPLPESCVAFILFPSQKNIPLIYKLKSHKTKVFYFFHEPLAKLSVYRKAGFSVSYLIKLWIINQISAHVVRRSDVVLLPSKKAVLLYEANKRYKNSNYHYLPLMYDDERSVEYVGTTRRFFSYIGTVAPDHSFSEYLEFVKWAINNNELLGVDFMIATKSIFSVPTEIESSERVVILKGEPLSDTVINSCFASSFLVWNAYSRTTQSGVLAKSFMFGTPVIVLKKNLSEFSEDGLDVVAIEDNHSFEQIREAINRVLREFHHYSDMARRRFEETFYYKKYNAIIDELIRQ